MHDKKRTAGDCFKEMTAINSENSGDLNLPDRPSVIENSMFDPNFTRPPGSAAAAAADAFPISLKGDKEIRRFGKKKLPKS